MGKAVGGSVEHILKDIHRDLGTGLNMALGALEDENLALDGSLQNINLFSWSSMWRSTAAIRGTFAKSCVPAVGMPLVSVSADTQESLSRQGSTRCKGASSDDQ